MIPAISNQFPNSINRLKAAPILRKGIPFDPLEDLATTKTFLKTLEGRFYSAFQTHMRNHLKLKAGLSHDLYIESW